MKIVSGNIVDIHQRRIYKGVIEMAGSKIAAIRETEEAPDIFILPGFVDSHIHIESSMLVPYEFARIALKHGTVATISDPHEIANVVGKEGVYYMIENARSAKLKFHFGAPSCVPATSFESAGAELNSEDVKELLASDDIFYLSEMMNYPGVLHSDPEVIKKLKHAQQIGKPIDGHAPGLKGDDAIRYIHAGISTDHECFTLEEALHKLKHGMKILIREGSAAKNYEALHSLIGTHPADVMFCSDDKHPDDLLEGHIDQLVKRSLKNGYNLFDILNIACKHPVDHYSMNVGLLKEGDQADFIVVDDVENFNVLQTWINGEKIHDNGKVHLKQKEHKIINNFAIDKVHVSEFTLYAKDWNVPSILAIDGELITEKNSAKPKIKNSIVQSDPAKDILKISVVNRYRQTQPSVGFIKGFGLKEGAIASTVAHDSHNIVAIGTSDEYLENAVNLLVESQGGLSAVSASGKHQISLPIAGLMSDKSCEEIGHAYAKIDRFVKTMGCKLKAPFMTLSFMALLVIPKIKMSDKGIFDAEAFKFY